MSALGVKALMQHLVVRDSLETIALEGLDPETIPATDLRDVFLFALDYFHSSGQTKAPSEAVLRAEFQNALEDNEIVFPDDGDPEESVEWAIDDLKGTYVHKRVSTLHKEFATAMAEAGTSERVEVLGHYASEFVGLSISMQNRAFATDTRTSMDGRLQAYKGRQENKGQITGMRFGIPVIDAYTGGIRPGELAILGSPPKVGKSYFSDHVALREWQAGRTPVIFTLENSVETTEDRLACQANGIEGEKWEHGECTEEEIDRVKTWIEQTLRPAPNPLWIVQPDMGDRTVERMVQEAQVRDADSIIIDQLSYIELPSPRKQKNERIGEALHLLHVMISTSRRRLPCLLTVQVNREGARAARKLGFLHMEHFADSSEIERTAVWAFGMYQTYDDFHAGQLKFQTLAARRARPRHFVLDWHIDQGIARFNREIELDTTAASSDS